MACSSILSEKALARFRTKPCERLLAQGRCDFQDKCQYSHQNWVRRNPWKVAYTPERCTQDGCTDRRCRYAHSEEEVMYHPQNYKVRICEPHNCCGFYCPFAHGPNELRQASDVEVNSQVDRPDTVEEEDTSFLRFDDRLRIHRADWESCAGKPGLLRGELKDKHDVSWSCLVQMVPYCRAQRMEAEEVVQEVRHWIRSSKEGPMTLRRSVATICVLWPPKAASCQPLSLCAPCSSTRTLLEQLAWQLGEIHWMGIAHCCLSPRSVFLQSEKSGRFVLGDFVEKVRLLSFLNGHCKVEEDKDFESWALWQPPEVLKKIKERAPRGQQEGDETKLDFFLVDVWQLGAVVFYALTGYHPFNTCENIMKNNLVNISKANHCPQLRKLLKQMLAPASRRLSLSALQAALQKLPVEVAQADLDSEAQVGARLRCVWPDGVQLRRNFGQDKLPLWLPAGDECLILERRQDWIRMAQGWLPLWGDRASAEFQPLFEVEEVAKKEMETKVTNQKEPSESEGQTFAPGGGLLSIESPLDMTTMNAFWHGFNDALLVRSQEMLWGHSKEHSDSSQEAASAASTASGASNMQPAKIALNIQLLDSKSSSSSEENDFVWM
ncbi:unnamed protein product [Durusdinium trenchii]|uniref:Protein kinase domain-containing protein n=1 Tax=Durusdinium trenchii TaxID=1381693 RepID=A0ABP0IHS4_9DINO